jgi:hypothetical protein
MLFESDFEENNMNEWTGAGVGGITILSNGQLHW